MNRLALLVVLPFLACGDDGIATGSGSSSTGAGPSTGVEPTTGAGPSTGPEPTGTTSSSSGDSESADNSSSGSTGTSTGGTSTTTDTTQGVEPGTSSSSGGSTSSSGEDSSSSSSTSTGASTDTGDTSDTGDDTGGGDGPVPGGMCIGNDLTTFVEPMPGPEELHIVAVYQPTNGAITVDIARVDIPLTLVLSSYEPVNYTLVLAPGVLLEHVILDGYNTHTVQGQGAAMVTDKSGKFDYLAACGYFWPENDGGCDTPGLVAGAEALTGLALTSFAGCYEGASFSLE